MGNYSAEERRQLLKQGKALPPTGDGPPRFPIDNPSDVDDAINLARTPEERAFIYKRAAALNCLGKIPNNWKADGSLRDS
jgi:hypothetical protein